MASQTTLRAVASLIPGRVRGVIVVIGKERTSWYEKHPPACTCAACAERKAEQRRFQEQHGQVKVGRNDPCPCGSGRKYKKCHGA